MKWLIAALAFAFSFMANAASLVYVPGVTNDQGPPGSLLSGNSASFVPSCTQSATFLARTTGLSVAETHAYNTMICAMVADGTWALLDGFYVFATNNATTAALNLKGTSYTATVIGAPTGFSPDVGWAGSASGQFYLDTGFNPTTAVSPGYTLNSSSLGIYDLTNRTTVTTYSPIGMTDNSTSWSSIMPMYTGSITYYDLNEYVFPSVAATTSLGSWLVSRTAASGAGSLSAYYNGAPLTSSNTASNALYNGDMFIYAINISGNPQYWTNDTLSAAWWGAGMTPTQAEAFQADLNGYMTALGVAAYAMATPPAAAATFGFTAKTFSENWASTSSIDLANTKAPGYRWYVNNAFPNMYANGSAWTPMVAATAGGASEVSLGTNLLTFTEMGNGGGTGNWHYLNTCVQNGANVIGTTFANGGYFQVFFNFDPTLSNSTDQGQWPIWWLAPQEFLNGSITNTYFTEIDGFEAIPAVSSPDTACANLCNTQMGNEDWNNFVGANNGYDFFMRNNLSTSFTYNSQHEYDLLWVPAAKNNGVGIIRKYVDGIMMINQTYSAAGTPNPPFSPANRTGALYPADAEHFCMMLGSGHAWPVTFGAINVWQ